jgi:hypothetical protein
MMVSGSALAAGACPTQGFFVHDIQNRTLSDDALDAPANDARPGWLDVSTPAGPARIRRMPPWQLFSQLTHFERRQMARDSVGTIADSQQRHELARFLQRCLVGTDHNRLLYPGAKGLKTITTWSDAVVGQLANQAAAFLEI